MRTMDTRGKHAESFIREHTRSRPSPSSRRSGSTPRPSSRRSGRPSSRSTRSASRTGACRGSGQALARWVPRSRRGGAREARARFGTGSGTSKIGGGEERRVSTPSTSTCSRRSCGAERRRRERRGAHHRVRRPQRLRDRRPTSSWPVTSGYEREPAERFVAWFRDLAARGYGSSPAIPAAPTSPTDAAELACYDVLTTLDLESRNIGADARARAIVPPMRFPVVRPRRLRATSSSGPVRETILAPNDFAHPMFFNAALTGEADRDDAGRRAAPDRTRRQDGEDAEGAQRPSVILFGLPEDEGRSRRSGSIPTARCRAPSRR